MKGRVRLAAILFTAAGSVALSGCLESMVKPEAAADTSFEQSLPPYDGPRARVAVTDFDWNVGSRSTRVSVGGTTIGVSSSQFAGISEGLHDMLTTALVQSKRYRVLERGAMDSLKTEMALSDEGFTDQSGIKAGSIRGADIAVIASVTGWDPASSGTGGTLGGLIGGKTGKLLGSVTGSMAKSSMAMDIRIVDVATSEVLAATRVEGEARDVNIGGALASLSMGAGGSLGTYARTPMEKAIRECIYEATRYIVDNTPSDYMRY